MVNIEDLLSLDNPVFRAYGFYSAVLVMKMLAMAPLTGKQRFRKKVFANPEDAAMTPKAKVKFDDPDVERVRRAHLNDLENLTPFFVVGFLYVCSNPAPLIAVNLFRLVAGARILHTFVYAIKPLPQPSRGAAFFAALAPTVYMAIEAARAFY